MAKSNKTTPAAKTAAAPAPAEKPEKEVKVPLAKMRGPRGVPETAKITVLVEGNPKREGSKAHAAFACYRDGMTVGEFCDAVNAAGQDGMGTPNLVYDAAHGFIKIEGYEPPGGVIQPKPKKEPKPKEEKAAKGKSAKTADPKAKAKADEEAEEEQID